MILYAQRIKYQDNYFRRFYNLLCFLYKRGISLFLIILSMLLLYFGPAKYFSDITLEINGKVIVIGLEIYNIILKPINFLSHKIALLRDLETENIELKLELVKLKSIKHKYLSIRAENESLRKILNVVPEPNHTITRARLLSISLNPFSKTILIAAGEKNGVTVDQVVTFQDELIGRVIQTNENYSKVMLINDLNSRIPVITSLTKQRAILAGECNKLTLLHLPEDNKIQENETIITSGDGKIYPYGLIVGHTMRTRNNQINVQPAVDLGNVDFVDIVN